MRRRARPLTRRPSPINRPGTALRPRSRLALQSCMRLDGPLPALPSSGGEVGGAKSPSPRHPT
eukprot:13627335-Alexandrium_andersonii.AAC.1